MTQRHSAAGAAAHHEQKLYRREAIDFQRYRFIGEPLRVGRPTLRPVAAALAALAFGIAGLSMVSHRPGFSGHLVARHGRTISVLLDGPGHAKLIDQGTSVTIDTLITGERNARVVAVEVRPDGRAIVRLAFPEGPQPPFTDHQGMLLRLPPHLLSVIP